MSSWTPQAVLGLIVIAAGVLALAFGALAGKLASVFLKLKLLAILACVAAFAILLAIVASKG